MTLLDKNIINREVVTLSTILYPLGLLNSQTVRELTDRVNNSRCAQIATAGQGLFTAPFIATFLSIKLYLFITLHASLVVKYT